MKKLLIAGLAALMLTACSTNPNSAFNKENIGTFLGGAAGAFAGAQFGGGYGQLAATAIGALGGALAGKEIGKSLDNADRTAATAPR